MASKQLEKTIVGLAEQKLIEFKDFVSNKSEDEEMLRFHVSSLFTQLTTLTELGFIKESGMSEPSTIKLVSIHNEVTKLSRAFSWMYN